MAISVFSSFLDLIDSTSVNYIATRLHEPGRAVSRGLESAIASLITGLAIQSGDDALMDEIFRLTSEAPSQLKLLDFVNAVVGSGGVSEGTASLIVASKKFISLAFGRDHFSILEAVGKSAGLRGSSVTCVMSIAAPLLMTTLGRRVRSEHLTRGQFEKLLVSENSGIQSVLPPGLQKHFDPIPRVATAVDDFALPISVSTVSEVRPALAMWWWVLPLLLLILLLLWLYKSEHARHVSEARQAIAELQTSGGAEQIVPLSSVKKPAVSRGVPTR